MERPNGFVMCFDSMYGSSGLFCKEIGLASICNPGSTWSAHIRSPCAFMDLSPYARNQNRWLTKYFHGIPYDFGETSLKNAVKTVNEYCEHENIWTCGADSTEFLTEILKRDVNNIQNSTSDLMTLSLTETCLLTIHVYRAHKYTCATNRALALAKAIRLSNRLAETAETE